MSDSILDSKIQVQFEWQQQIWAFSISILADVPESNEVSVPDSNPGRNPEVLAANRARLSSPIWQCILLLITQVTLFLNIVIQGLVFLSRHKKRELVFPCKTFLVLSSKSHFISAVLKWNSKLNAANLILSKMLIGSNLG